MAETHIWTGESGKSYLYEIYEIGAEFNSKPGNYIFAKVSNNLWVPVYIGETSDLSERFDSHHKMWCIKDKCATHIHVHLSDDDKDIRLKEESDLRANYDPSCNGNGLMAALGR